MENIHPFGAVEKGIEGKKILEEIVAEKCSYLNSPKEFKNPRKVRHKENHTEALCFCCVCAQWCLTPCDPMDCSLPGSSVHGILHARILEWVASSFSRESTEPRNWTHTFCVSCTGGQILSHWATWEAHHNQIAKIKWFRKIS